MRLHDDIDHFINVLDAYGARAARHGNNTLMEHLLGTHALLKAWANSNVVCVAGLFHTFYGSRAYRDGLADPEDRRTLIAIIGHEAEDLVWHYSRLSLSGFLENQCNGPSYYAFDRPTCAALAEICLANLLEQLEDAKRIYSPKKLAAKIREFEGLRHLLSSDALKSLEANLKRTLGGADDNNAGGRYPVRIANPESYTS